MSSAIEVARQGLNINNKLLSVAAENIQRSDDPDYSKQTPRIITGGHSSTQIATIERFYDENLNRNIRDQLSNSSKYHEISNHMAVIKGIVGAGNNDDLRSPEKLVNEFFSSMHTLAGSTINDSLKINVVNRGQQLASHLSDISAKLYNEQYIVDKEISTSIERVNVILANLREINKSISPGDNDKGQNNQLYQTRDNLLKQLAEHIDINVNINKDGVTDISTKAGAKLLGNHTYGELEYNATNSHADFTNHGALDQIKVNLYDYEGNLLRETEIVTRGVSGKDIQSNVSTGKISGLLTLRDDILPKMNQTLDHFAKEVSFQVNKIHNTGTGFPPLTNFTGTTRTKITEYTDWSGTVRIAVVDQAGRAIKHDDGTEFKALDLNLEKLDGGQGAGRPDMKTILREINQHFNGDVGARRAEVIDSNSTEKIFRDIKMVATSNLISPTPANNIMKFKMEIDSVSQSDTSFSISNIIVRDQGGVVVPNAGSINNGYSTIKAGDKATTEQEMEIDVGAIPNPPYEIDIEYKTMNEDGKFSSGTITYILNPSDPSDMMNMRFVADSALGSAQMKDPDGQAYMSAHLIDEYGNIILENDANTLGVLSIKTNKEQYRIIIDDVSSAEKGLPATSFYSETAATEKGFSHFFGLNNFFISSSEEENYALNMKINSRLVAKPDSLSTGRMVPTNSFTSEQVSLGQNKANMTMEFADATNFNAADTISVLGQTFRMVPMLTGANDEIAIGADLNSSLDNIVVTLNQIYHPGMLLTENTSNAGTFSLRFTAAHAGFGGNNFDVSGNFAAVQGDISDGLGMQNNPSGFLTGGDDTTVVKEIKTYGYNTGRDANQVMLEFSALDKKNFNISAAGGLSGGSMTLEAYATSFIGYSLREDSYATSSYENSKILYENFQSAYESGASVNVEDEQMKAYQIAQLSNTLTKLIAVESKMFDQLLSIL